MLKLTGLVKGFGARIGNRFIVILIILTAALTLAGGIWLIELMRSEALPASTSQKADCASCHAEIYADWHKGAHSDARSKHAMAEGTNCLACHKENSSDLAISNPGAPSFKDFWVKEGMPNDCLSCHVTGYDAVTKSWASDGIACETCHGVIPASHPDSIVASTKSEETCRTCHTDDRFDWGLWKESVHSQSSISCVDCHNPHTTALKTQGSPSALCGSCHKKIAESSEHSSHEKLGITCIDCHLGEPKGNDDFHQIPDHDFKAKVETCNKCHTNQMHFAGLPKETSVLRAVSSMKARDLPKTSVPLAGYKNVIINTTVYVAAAIIVGAMAGVVLRKLIAR